VETLLSHEATDRRGFENKSEATVTDAGRSHENNSMANVVYLDYFINLKCKCLPLLGALALVVCPQSGNPNERRV